MHECPRPSMLLIDLLTFLAAHIPMYWVLTCLVSLVSNFAPWFLLPADLQDQGYILKSNTLEEVLRSSQKMEAKLIGYDENLIDVSIPDAIGLENLKVCNAKIHSTSKMRDARPARLVAVSEQLPSSLDMTGGLPSETIADHRSNTDSQTIGLSWITTCWVSISVERCYI